MKEFGKTGYWEERWGKKKKVIIEMEGNWDDVDKLIALLKHWQGCGGVGHSAHTKFFMDGDGPSHPNFTIDRKKIKDFKSKFFKVNSKDNFEEIEGWDKISEEDLE